MYKESLVYYGTSEQNELARTGCGNTCEYNPVNDLPISRVPTLLAIVERKEKSGTLEFLVIKLVLA
jgi:hypothetical protein